MFRGGAGGMYGGEDLLPDFKRFLRSLLCEGTGLI